MICAVFKDDSKELSDFNKDQDEIIESTNNLLNDNYKERRNCSRI